MNIIKQGDSLGLLDEVENGTVQTIYFDPPFKTQRVYRLNPDNEIGFSDIRKSHQSYIDFIEPLVIKCKNKLALGGSFFFHICAEQMLIPQMVCDRHFKRVQPIFWKKSRSKNNVKTKLGAAVDVIFWCSNAKKPKFNMVYQELDSYYAEHSYKNEDERGNYALGHIVYTPTQRVTSLEKEYEIALQLKGEQKEKKLDKLRKRLKAHPDADLRKLACEKDKDRLYAFTHDNITYKPEAGWRLSKEKLDELVADNRIHFPKKEGANPYKKIYKHESKGKPCMDLWDDIHSIAQGNERRLYPTEKPEKLIERIIEMSSDEGDIVLDPVAGSGTTGVVAKNMNRDFILFDINPDAIKIAKERIFT